MTPSTPVIPLIHDVFITHLRKYLRKALSIDIKGMHNSIGWFTIGFQLRSFELLPEKKFASKSLTCVKNNLDIDVAGFVKTLREEKKLSIDGGYGKIKGKTFRISNMGNRSSESINYLLEQMDDILPRFQ